MVERIFREYDIRGLWGDEIDTKLAYKIGYFFGQRSAGGEIVVGFDGRHGARPVFTALACGINKSGSIVKSLGLIPTPMVYYANEKLSPSAAIMITASHNSKEYIGFKMIEAGTPFCGEAIKELRDFVLNSDLEYQDMGEVQITEINLEERYLDRILQNITISPSMKVAWDIGNGAAGSLISRLVKKMPNENMLFNENIDANFSNRSPDPTNHKNLEQFVKEVAKHQCDLGVAFDGDGDRVVFVTANGNILEGDIALLIFAQNILKNHPGSTIISEVKASRVFFEGVQNAGGNPIMDKTGHSNIKQAIKKHNAILAGELSCHFFFLDDYYGYDDAIYASLRMVDIISQNGQSLEKILDAIEMNPILPEVKISVSEDQKFVLIDKLKAILKEEKRAFIDLDGVRCESQNGWWLIRASNTSPAVCIRAEAQSEDQLRNIKVEVKSYLERLGINLDNTNLT